MKYILTALDNKANRNRLFIEHEFNSADNCFDRCQDYTAKLFVGEKSVTIRLVNPTVLHLHKLVVTMKKTIHYCRGLATVLQLSLRKRFAGIFKTCHMFTPPSISAHLQLPFEDTVYAIATTLDPRFSFQWLEIDVCLESDDNHAAQRICNRIKHATQGIHF